jgi:large subunit ribosomal protein L29
MKITKELRDMSTEERLVRLEEFKKELLKLNVQVASGANTANPGKLKQTRKNIARIKTLQREVKS